MKRSLFFLVFLICSIFSFSQSPAGFPTQFNTGWQRWGYSQSDSGSIIAVRDTSWTPRFAGTVVTWRNTGVDTSLWMYTGFKWLKLLKTGDASAAVWGTITGTLSNQTDLQNALNLKLNISDTASMLTPYLNLTGYGIVRSGQAIRVDTSQVATQHDLLSAQTIQQVLTTGDTANRRINFRDLGDSSTTHIFHTSTIRPPNYNVAYATGTQGLINTGYSYYTGVNADGRPNVVYSPYAYNMNPGGATRLISGEAAFGTFYEQNFIMGGGFGYFEKYDEISQSDGFSYRPFFSVFRKSAREHTFTRKITTENVLYLSPTGADDTALVNLTAQGQAWGSIGEYQFSATNRRAPTNTFMFSTGANGPTIGGTGSVENKLTSSVPLHVNGAITNTNTYGGNVLLGQTGVTNHLRFLAANQSNTTRAGIFNQSTATEVTYIGIGINSSFLFGNGVTASTGGSVFLTSNPGVPSIQFATKAAGSTTDIVAGVFGQNGNFNVGGGAITTPPEEITVDVRSSAATNTIVTNEASRHTTSGTAAAGFGVQKSWILESGGGGERTVALDAVVLTTATNTNEYADRVFYLMTNGAAASEKMRLTGLGTLHIGAYTAGANVDSRGLYLRRSIGAFPDSIETITSIGSDFVQVLDASTGKFKKITAANLGVGVTSVTASNGLTHSGTSTVTITLGGALTGTTDITGASNTLRLGTSGSKLNTLAVAASSQISLVSDARINLLGNIAYQAENVTADANYTVLGNTGIVELQTSGLTTDRTITLPAASTHGQVLTIVVRFASSGSHFTFASAVLNNATGSTVTQLEWGTTYKLMVNASLSWMIVEID